MQQPIRTGYHRRTQGTAIPSDSPFRKKPLAQLIGAILLSQLLINPTYAAPTN